MADDESVEWVDSGLYTETGKASEIIGGGIGFDLPTVEDLRQESAIVILGKLRGGHCTLDRRGIWRAFVWCCVRYVAMNMRRHEARRRHWPYEPED